MNGSTDLSSSSLSIAKPDWETYCHKVADMIIQEQSPARVMEVRAKLYELLSHCIPPSIIMKVRSSCLSSCGRWLTCGYRPQTIADKVVDQVDEALKADIMHWAAIYVRRISMPISWRCHARRRRLEVAKLTPPPFFFCDAGGTHARR